MLGQGAGGAPADVVGPPPGDALLRDQRLLSVAVLLSYGIARVLLGRRRQGDKGGAQPSGPYTGPLTVVNVSNYKTVRAKISRSPGRRRG
jgi:competence protein ComEC